MSDSSSLIDTESTGSGSTSQVNSDIDAPTQAELNAKSESDSTKKKAKSSGSSEESEESTKDTVKSEESGKSESTKSGSAKSGSGSAKSGSGKSESAKSGSGSAKGGKRGKDKAGKSGKAKGGEGSVDVGKVKEESEDDGSEEFVMDVSQKVEKKRKFPKRALTKKERKLNSFVICVSSLPFKTAEEFEQHERLVTKIKNNSGGRVKFAKDVKDVTTHLVLGTKSRSLKLMEAISRGIYVVNYDWFIKFSEKLDWVSPYRYECDEWFSGCSISRADHQLWVSKKDRDRKVLFDGLDFIFVGKFKKPSPGLTDLRRLVKNLDGNLLAAPESPVDFMNGLDDEDEKNLVVISANHVDSNELDPYESVKPVTLEWLFDSIVHYKIYPKKGAYRASKKNIDKYNQKVEILKDEITERKKEIEKSRLKLIEEKQRKKAEKLAALLEKETGVKTETSPVEEEKPKRRRRKKKTEPETEAETKTEKSDSDVEMTETSETKPKRKKHRKSSHSEKKTTEKPLTPPTESPMLFSDTSDDDPKEPSEEEKSDSDIEMTETKPKRKKHKSSRSEKKRKRTSDEEPKKRRRKKKRVE